MLLVAFSRRMCCSRVCSASRSAGLPSASRDSPTSRPGQLAGERLAHREVAGVRAAEAQRHPEPLRACRRRRPRPARRAGSAGSAPAGPRRRRPARRARAPRRSAPTGRAPRPTPPGRTAAAPNSSPSGSPSPRSATTSSMPSGSARVCSTSSVCGSVSASTTNRRGLRLPGPAQQGHRLRGRGRLVEQRRAGDGQAGQVGDRGLEGQQRLQPALADLGLVRRVGGVPGGVLQHVAPDHRRGDACRCSPARSSARSTRVAGGERAQLREGLGLGGRAPAGRARPRRRGRGSTRAAPGRPARRARRRRWSASMVASSSGRGPTCRSTNGRPCSRSCRLGRGDVLAHGRASRSATQCSGRAGTQAGRHRPPPLSPPGDPGT